MVTVYGIKNCTAMKKAFDWLNQHGVPFSFVDYKSEQVLEARLVAWIDMAGINTLVNRRGLTWKKLSGEECSVVDAVAEAPTVKNTKAVIALLKKYPTLIKRPVLEFNETLLVGFEASDYQACFADRK